MTSPLAVSRVFRSSTGSSTWMVNVAVAIVAAAVMVMPVHADQNWDGDGTQGNFSWNENWYGNTQPGWGFGGSLWFNLSNNASQTSLYYDYNNNWSNTDNIYWDTTFPKSQTLSALNSGLNFNTRIENRSSQAQTLNMSVSGAKNGSSDIQLNPVNGNLTLTSTANLYNDNSVDYNVYGNTGKTLTLNLNLGVGTTAANVDFTVNQNSLVQMNASQSYAGTTRANNGSITTGSGVTLATSSVVVAGGSFATTSANVVPNSASVSISSGVYTLGGDDTVASFTISGGSLGGSSTLTASTYSLNGGTVSGKLGSGTATVAGSVTVNNTVGAATVNMNSGSLLLNAANLLSDSAAVTVAGGTMTFGGSDTIGSLAGSGGTVAIGANALTVSQSGNTTFAGAITGNGTFTKSGSGILTITGNAAAYAGATQVQAGTVAVNGSLGGTVDVSLNAILSGTGTIGGNASIAGTLNPGGSGAVGTPTINGNLTYAAGSILSWELFANNASIGSYDQISVPNGNLTFSGSTAVAMSFNGAGSAVAWSNSFWNVSRSWLVQDLGTGVTNNFNNLSISNQNWLDSTGAAFNTARPGSSFTLTQQGQDVLITYVPEPSTIVALIGGLAGVAGVRIRRRRAM